jgi:hypothetical protein
MSFHEGVDGDVRCSNYDQCFTHGWNWNVNGFKTHLLAMNDLTKRPKLMNMGCYLLSIVGYVRRSPLSMALFAAPLVDSIARLFVAVAGVLCSALCWPYRLWMEGECVRVHFTFDKLVWVR